MARIGFVGVGFMGHGMAANLLKAGHQITVIAHRNRAPVEDLKAKGAGEAASLAELARGQDAVFLCVTGTPQVESTLAAIGPVLQKGQIVVDTGTSEPTSSVRLAAELAERGIGWADAPIGGGQQHAERGELASMVGATDADFARIEPWLRKTSKVVQHMGPPGAGHRAKLLNNLVAVGQAALVVQAYEIARHEGLDWAKLYEIMMAGAARSGSLERIMVPALKGDMGGYVFTAGNAEKDLAYFVNLATSVGSDASVGAALRDYFASCAQRRGRGPRQAQPLVELTQQHHPAVAAQPTAVEVGLDHSPADPPKLHLRLGTIWHRRISSPSTSVAVLSSGTGRFAAPQDRHSSSTSASMSARPTISSTASRPRMGANCGAGEPAATCCVRPSPTPRTCTSRRSTT